MPLPRTRACERCGKPARYRFCSNDCRADGARKLPDRACEFCGTLFAPRPNVAANGFARFCSKPCANRARYASETIADRMAAFIRDDIGDQCVDWPHAMHHTGYGVLTFKQRLVYAHRAVLMARGIDVPDNAVVMHRCDRPSCVNWRHLAVASVQENRRDAVTKRRHSHGEHHGRAKATAADVAEIRHTYTGKRGQIAALARRYGMSITSMCDIVHSRHHH